MIRIAVESDLPRIFEVYAAARKIMADNGNPTQWADFYPPHDMLREDIPLQQLYVVERDGIICAAFAFIVGEDPSYGYIEDGAWRRSDTYAAIHRVGSDGTQSGIFDEVLTFCREKWPYLRIDTHADNRIMQHLVTKNGFRRSGIVYMCDDGTPRIAYEWYEGME